MCELRLLNYDSSKRPYLVIVCYNIIIILQFDSPEKKQNGVEWSMESKRSVDEQRRAFCPIKRIRNAISSMMGEIK